MQKEKEIENTNIDRFKNLLTNDHLWKFLDIILGNI